MARPSWPAWWRRTLPVRCPQQPPSRLDLSKLTSTELQHSLANPCKSKSNTFILLSSVNLLFSMSFQPCSLGLSSIWKGLLHWQAFADEGGLQAPLPHCRASNLVQLLLLHEDIVWGRWTRAGVPPLRVAFPLSSRSHLPLPLCWIHHFPFKNGLLVSQRMAQRNGLPPRVHHCFLLRCLRDPSLYIPDWSQIHQLLQRVHSLRDPVARFPVGWPHRRGSDEVARSLQRADRVRPNQLRVRLCEEASSCQFPDQLSCQSWGPLPQPCPKYAQLYRALWAGQLEGPDLGH